MHSVDVAERLLQVVADRTVLSRWGNCTRKLWQAVDALLYQDAEWPGEWGEKPEWADSGGGENAPR